MVIDMENKKDNLFKGDGMGTKHDTAPHCFKISQPYDSILRSLPDKSNFLRLAVIEKMQRDGLIPPNA
jgi:hypothetical protein